MQCCLVRDNCYELDDSDIYGFFKWDTVVTFQELKMKIREIIHEYVMQGNPTGEYTIDYLLSKLPKEWNIQFQNNANIIYI